MIKRFKFLVIILVLSIYSKINCSDFPRSIIEAIALDFNFNNLTPEQKAIYLPQIHKDGEWIPIYYACFKGNVSAFKWLLSNGARPDKECFGTAIISDNPKSEIVSELLIRGLYTKYIGITTLQRVQDRLAVFSGVATKHPDLFAAHFAEAQKISVMINRYEDEVGLRTAWNAAVVSAGASYPGAGSGVVVSDGCVKIEE